MYSQGFPARLRMAVTGDDLVVVVAAIFLGYRFALLLITLFST